MKKIHTPALLLLLGALAFSTAGAAPLNVVTTIFPLYDWARVVGGEQAEVVQLLPPGVEAHGYAPKPSDLIRLNQADVFFYLSPHMEPWAEDLARGLDPSTILVVEVAKDISMDCEEEGHEACTHHGQDPHVWLDPVLAQQMVAIIAEAFAKKDPAHADQYRANAQAYVKQLQDLDARITAMLATCRHKTILYGGHFAFGHFAYRYGLDHQSPYPGFAPNAQPSPRAVAELARTMKEKGFTVIYHEELIRPTTARIIAEETGARLLLLHGAHNTTADERAQGVTYLSIMNDNVERLQEGLR